MDADLDTIEGAVEIGRRLREAREKRGLTQVVAASRLGIVQPTLYAYESGARTPPLRFLQKAAKLYGVRACWVLEGDEAETVGGADLDPIAVSALRELPHVAQRRLMLDIWPAMQHLYREIQPLGNVLGER